MNNKNKKQNEQNNTVFLILIAVAVVVFLVLVVLKIINRHNLDVDSKLVTSLHNTFSTEDLGNCEVLLNYSEEKVEYDKIDSETRLCLAYQKSEIPEKLETITYDKVKKKNICEEDGMVFRANDETEKCVVQKVKKDIIDNTYKNIFGKDIEENESFKVDSDSICFLKDNYYYCGDSEVVTYTFGNESTIYRVIQKAVEKGSEIEIYDYFIKVNDKICYKNYTADTINQNHTNQYEKNLIFSILKYIETHYKDGTLTAISEELNLPPYYVSKLLKRNLNTNFKELLQQRKLQQAAYLLSQTPLTAETIMDAIGYDNSSYFYRKFREKYGCSPKDYRRKS